MCRYISKKPQIQIFRGISMTRYTGLQMNVQP